MSQQDQAVTAHLTINCGCGFIARNNKEAVEHAAEKRHVLTVHGVIRPSKRLEELRREAVR